MVQGKVEICGVNTAKLPLLKQQEKEALFVRIKDGDIEAREEFIKGNGFFFCAIFIFYILTLHITILYFVKHNKKLKTKNSFIYIGINI